MYSYLQKLAVGLEQVALDQIIYDGVYDEEFNLAEYRLKGVSIIQDIHIQISLCNELQVCRNFLKLLYIKQGNAKKIICCHH